VDVRAQSGGEHVVSTPALTCKQCFNRQREVRLLGTWVRNRCGVTGSFVELDDACTAPVELLFKQRGQIAREIIRRTEVASCRES
jgi:hypothetical protein